MSGKSSGSVTGWIEELKGDNPEAQQKIWNRFVKRLVEYANNKLGGVNRSVVDADDIASMAFQNFFNKTPEGFERLINRNDLWKILTLLAERRAIDQVRKWYNQTNGDRWLVSEASLVKGNSPSHGFDGLAGAQFEPEIEMILAEEVQTRLDSLQDEVMQKIAIEKLQGYKNQEIAERLTITLRTVERKLKNIRDIFAAAVT